MIKWSSAGTTAVGFCSSGLVQSGDGSCAEFAYLTSVIALSSLTMEPVYLHWKTWNSLHELCLLPSSTSSSGTVLYKKERLGVLIQVEKHGFWRKEEGGMLYVAYSENGSDCNSLLYNAAVESYSDLSVLLLVATVKSAMILSVMQS